VERSIALKRLAVSGSRFKRGPEDEPAGLALESMRWNGLFGRFGDKQDWWAGLAEVDLPVLAVAPQGIIRTRRGLAASCSSSRFRAQQFPAWGASRALPTISGMSKCWSAKRRRLKSGHWWRDG
jgi:hypothetical protein